jgi:predicted MFS family arabinose efflux permease
MSLTQKEKDAIHERVENMTPTERRDRMNKLVNESIIKSVLVHTVLLVYILASLYIKQNYEINSLIYMALIGVGIFWTYACMLTFQAYLFFKSAKNLSNSFSSSIQDGIDFLDSNE